MPSIGNSLAGYIGTLIEPIKEAKSKLVSTVIELLNNESKQEEMKRNIGATAITNADEIVAAEVLRIIDLDGAIA